MKEISYLLRKSVAMILALTVLLSLSALHVAAEETKHKINIQGGVANDAIGLDKINESKKGEQVEIVAVFNAKTHVFVEWQVVKGEVTIEDSKQEIAYFDMPDEEVEIKAVYREKTDSDPTRYQVKILRGIATKGENPIQYAEAGEKLGIKSFLDGFSSLIRFLKWRVIKGNLMVEDENNAETTFVMPAEDVVIEALEIQAAIDIEVEDGIAYNHYGESIDRQFFQESVIIRCKPAPEGKVFEKWEVLEGEPLDQLAEKSEEASFEMPSEKVKIKAVYREIEDGETKRYPIRVQDGAAMQDGNIVFSAEKGKKIVLEYNGAIEHFTKWHVVKGNLALEEDYGNFYFIMPEEEVEIKAITTEPKYQITVTGGKANDVISGKEVTTAKKYALLGIKAEYDPATHVFVKWEVVKGTEDSFFGVSIQSEYFEFVMPAEEVEIQAIYTDQATTAPEVLLPYIPEQEVEDETIPQGDPKEDDKKKDDKSEEERDKSKESTDSKDSSKGEKDKTDGKPEDKTDSKTDTDGKTDNAPTTDAKGDTALKDTKDETITESEVPKGVLPKTAGAPFALFWLFGVGISGMGVWIKKRR